MSAAKNGGPAFPHDEFRNIGVQRPGFFDAHPGMTLRDWFAGQALAAIIQADGAQYFNISTEHAECAYRKADAMLAERSKP